MQVQVGTAAVRALERIVFKRVRALVLPKGVPVSGDDWKWKANFPSMPFCHRLAGARGNGWLGDNVVTVFTMFCVYTRKRVSRVRGAFEVLESSFLGMLASARELREELGPDHGLILVVDRGYCSRLLVARRSCLQLCLVLQSAAL